MEFYWERWETTDHHVNECPEKGLLRVLNSGLDLRDSRSKEFFLDLWKYWWSKNPNVCTLATITKCNLLGGKKQLRLWFGEPDSYCCGDHVRSNGYNLIVSVYGTKEQLRGLLAHMIPVDEFEIVTVSPTPDAHYDGNFVPTDVIEYRRKKKEKVPIPLSMLTVDALACDSAKNYGDPSIHLDLLGVLGRFEIPFKSIVPYSFYDGQDSRIPISEKELEAMGIPVTGSDYEESYFGRTVTFHDEKYLILGVSGGHEMALVPCGYVDMDS